MNVRGKFGSVILIFILIFNLIIIFNIEEVQAARDDMNLEGDIYLNQTYMLANNTWQNNTEFCIWVYHVDHWTRYPSAGWRLTSMGRYFYMLPREDNGTHWSGGDKYRVQVNAEPFWNATNTNYSSHGTGDAGEFTPSGSIENYIVWDDPDNWQRWDVQLPGVDLKPTNVKVDNQEYQISPAYITIEGGQDVAISGNVTNIGISEPPTGFNFTFFNSTNDGDMLSTELLLDIGITAKLSPGDETGEYSITWHVPSSPGIYFVALHADHYNVVPESNKVNNLFLIGFIVGGVPDLELNNVLADDIKYDSSPSTLIYVGKGQSVSISVNVTNIGTENTGLDFLLNITLTYIPGTTPSENLLSKTLSSLDPQEDAGEQKIEWTTPDFNTQCKITIKVDPANRIQEIREDNNEFVLNFEVRDLPDLKVENITPLTRTVPIGSFNKIEVKVWNIGNIQSNSSSLGFYNGTEFDDYVPGTNLTTALQIYDITGLQPSQEVSSGLQATWLAPMIIGMYTVSVKIDLEEEIAELKEINNIVMFTFIVEDYPEPPIPELMMDGNDIKLTWTDSPTDNRAYYLIYRSETKTGFDFSMPYFNTSRQLLPLSNDWADENGNDDAPELYYCIRTVNEHGWVGYTSLTVGKFTKTFALGYDTFSLPLDPFEQIKASEFLDSLTKPGGSSPSEINGMTTVYRLDVETQQWLGRPKFLPENVDNFELEFGKGYMFYTPEEVAYTFTGYPGSMIRYIEILPTTEQFRISLDLVFGIYYHLKFGWPEVNGATNYNIYNSNSRTGFNYSLPLNVTDTNSISLPPQEAPEGYYTVVPVDKYGRFGSSAYSVGVTNMSFGSEYDTFGLKVEPDYFIYTVSDIMDEFFTIHIDTIYYYDDSLQMWQGHPRYLPRDIDNFDLVAGDAYVTYIYQGELRFMIVGR